MSGQTVLWVPGRDGNGYSLGGPSGALEPGNPADSSGCGVLSRRVRGRAISNSRSVWPMPLPRQRPVEQPVAVLVRQIRAGIAAMRHRMRTPRNNHSCPATLKNQVEELIQGAGWLIGNVFYPLHRKEHPGKPDLSSYFKHCAHLTMSWKAEHHKAYEARVISTGLERLATRFDLATLPFPKEELQTLATRARESFRAYGSDRRKQRLARYRVHLGGLYGEESVGPVWTALVEINNEIGYEEK